jgi:hypothetical protein
VKLWFDHGFALFVFAPDFRLSSLLPAGNLTCDIVNPDRPKSSAVRSGVAKQGRSMLRPYNQSPATSFISWACVPGPWASVSTLSTDLLAVKCEVSIEDPDVADSANLLSP